MSAWVAEKIPLNHRAKRHIGNTSGNTSARERWRLIATARCAGVSSAQKTRQAAGFAIECGGQLRLAQMPAAVEGLDWRTHGRGFVHVPVARS